MSLIVFRKSRTLKLLSDLLVVFHCDIIKLSFNLGKNSAKHIKTWNSVFWRLMSDSR